MQKNCKAEVWVLGQVRNVALIVIITAVMAVATTLLAHLFDVLPASVASAISKEALEAGTLDVSAAAPENLRTMD